MNKQTNIAPFVRIVAVDGKAYPVAPGAALTPSPDVGAAPTPIIAEAAPVLGNTGAAEVGTPVASVAPISCGEAQHELQSRADTGLPGAMGGKIPTASPAPTYHAKPDCQQCGRGYWGCICGCPEPEAEWFKPGGNYDPDLHTQAMQSREAY